MGLQVGILASIVVTSLAVGYISYQSSSNVANAVEELTSQDIRSNAEIQVSDLSNILTNKIESITSNLQIISTAPSIQDKDVIGGSILLDEGQRTTGDFAQYYTWLDEDGKVLWISNANSTLQERFIGADLSQREYFIAAKESLKPYYSTVIESINGQDRIFFAYPILDRRADNDSFKGVIFASSNLQGIGSYLQSQTPKKYQSSIGMIDREGTILFSGNSSLTGKNIFGPEIQAALPSAGGFKESFNKFISESLEGEQGSGEFSVGSVNAIIAYNPISIRGSNFGVLYTVITSDPSANINDLLDRQSFNGVFLIASVGGIAVSASYLVITWNRKLETLVKNKTFELNAAAEKLQEADRSKEEFSSMITHELKTPLVPIIGYGNLLLEGRLGGMTMQQREKIQIMYSNAMRLSKLIQDVLDVRKLDMGRMNLAKQQVPVRELLERSVNAFKPMADSNGVKLESIIADGEDAEKLQSYCDPERIHQVLCNLISNAIKFVPPHDGKIEVSAAPSIQDSSVVVFSVKDNGIGIPPEKQKNLFTKFYQVDTSLTRNVGGTGLGLTIAKGIVEAHGGKMWVESEQAKGSIFHFSIPMEDKK